MNKRDAKATLKTFATAIEGFVSQIADETRTFERKVGAIRLRIGETFAEAQESGALAALELQFIEWARETYESAREAHGLQAVSPPTLYRWLNAGTVARVLGDAVHSDAEVGSLVPLYRILKSAKTEEERGAAEDLVRAAYQAACDESEGAPQESVVMAHAEKMAPPSRGKASAPKEPNESEGSDESGEESGEEINTAPETLELNGETLTLVRGNVESFIGKTVKDHGVPENVVRAIIGWAALTAREHGAPYLVAAIQPNEAK